ncbi:MAG: hypothetical protein QG653_239 [Patescibacteria group bacterium]|nr:hypothetical protein [Patescibacteria group bacterium]
MTTHTFNIENIFSKSWEKTKDHVWFLVLSVLIFLGITSIFQEVFLIGYIVKVFVLLSLSSVVLTIVHDRKPKIHDLTKYFANYKKPLRMLIISIIVHTLTILGLFLFIIPGIYIGIRFMFYQYYVLEHEHKTIGESLQEIFSMTEGNFWKLFLFSVVALFVNFLGILALGVGFLITFPITLLASGYIYKTITPHYKR